MAKSELKSQSSRTSPSQASAGKTSPDKTSSGKVSLGKASAGKVSPNTTRSDKASARPYLPRLKALYFTELRPRLQQSLGIENPLAVPRLEKIVLNMGVGEATSDRKFIEGASDDLRRISGQQPVVTRAKKSIAAFKVRENMALGVKATLRGDRMYEFLDRLVTIALPRVRDFRGLSPRAFDSHGNYSLGLHEQIVFPEIDYDKVAKIRGMQVVICTNSSNDAHALELLRGFNLPFSQAS